MTEITDQTTDAELVELTLHSQRYFGFIMPRYRDTLLRYIRRLTQVSQEEAEDILQEVFIKVYQNLRSYNPDLAFSSWIYRITRNEVISQHRKTKARPHGNSIAVDHEILKNIASGVDVHSEIMTGMQLEAVQTAIEALDLKYRDVLILRYIEDRTYDDIADILKKPPGTVATLLNRAKKKLKKEMIKQDI
jgi:RNA polymerase sigma-70 factor (ECF subfamily)